MKGDELRIRLEGAWEEVQADLARWEKATRSLSRRDWAHRFDWRTLDEHANANTAAQALERLATQTGSIEGRDLLARWRRARAAYELQLARRARSLRLDPAEEGLLARVRDEVPVVLRTRFREPIRLVSAAIGAATTIASVAWAWRSLPTSSAIAAACVLGSLTILLLAAASRFDVDVMLTRRRLMVGKRAWPLADVELVHTHQENESRRHFVLDVYDRSRTRYRWHLGGTPERLIESLVAVGVTTRAEI